MFEATAVPLIRQQVRGDPVASVVPGASYDNSYGELWFDCPSGRLCVVKARTFSGDQREQIATKFARGGCCERGGLAEASRCNQGTESHQDRGGAGWSAEMVPGQYHVRMNMYIAQATNGNFKIVKSLGVIDPKECMRGMK